MWRWAARVGAAWAILCTSCGGDDGARDASADGPALDVRAERIDTGSAGPPTDTGLGGLPDTFDPNCHWDCFFGITCIDGVVWQQVHAPVPCERWTGMCPQIERGRCSEGCSDRIPPSPRMSIDWRLWCEESEGRRPDDPCESDADCQPPEGVEPGGRNYLACDLTASRCIAVEAPVAPSDACEASFEGLFSPTLGSAYGVVSDPSCDSGWCRFSARIAPDECDAHVCALACEDDWDCPRDYRCEGRSDWTGRRIEDGAGTSVSVCVTSASVDVICH